MIPVFTTVGIVLAVMLAWAGALARNSIRRADLLTAEAVVCAAVLANALGNLDDEWVIALLWAAVTPLACVNAYRARRRVAVESPTPKHEQVP